MKIQDIQDILKFTNCYNFILDEKTDDSVFLPPIVKKTFDENANKTVIVQYNDLLLFAKIAIDSNQKLIVGPIATQYLLDLIPIKLFAYIKDTANYAQIKKIVDHAPILSVTEFKNLIQKIAGLISPQSGKIMLVHRNNHQYQVQYESDRDLDTITQQIMTAISHGDKKEFIRLLNVPQIFRGSFISQKKTSRKEIQRHLYFTLFTVGNLAIEQGVSESTIEALQNKYYQLWENSDLSPTEVVNY